MRIGLVCAVVVVLLAACGGSGDDELAELAEAGLVTTTTIDRATIGDFPDATSAVASLVDELGAPVRALSATLTYDRVTLQVRSKENPDDVDSYTYSFEDREWSNPTPLRLRPRDVEQLDDRVFDVTAVNWSAIPELGPAALEHFEALERPGVGSASITRAGGDLGPESFRIRMGVSGSRGSGSVEADAVTGDVLLFQRR